MLHMFCNNVTCHVTQHLNLITSEMFSLVFVDVHVVKVGSIVFSDLNHGSGTVEPWIIGCWCGHH